MAKFFVGALQKVCWGVLCGVCIGNFWRADFSWGFWVAVAGAVGVIVLVLFRRLWLVMMCLLFLIGVVLGFWRWQETLQESQFIGLYGQNLQGFGVAVGDTEVSQSGNQVVVFRPDGFSQHVRVSLFKHAYVKSGDRIVYSGQLKQPENFSDFDYVSYLEKQNVYAELKSPKVFTIEPNRNFWSTSRDKLRSWSIARIKSALSKDHSDVVLGMLFGIKPNTNPGLSLAFQKTGLTHILVVSGYNLTVLANALGVFAWLVGRRRSDLVSLAVVWVFVFVVGFSSSVVRAGVMASIFLLARLFGRASFSLQALLVAVSIMVVVNPKILFFDIGFQLSVAATWGVIVISKIRSGVEHQNVLAEAFWPTLGAILLTAPLVAYYFGKFSVVAPFANLAVVPFVPIVMLLGILMFLPNPGLSLIPPVLQFVLSGILTIITKLSGLSFSLVSWNPDINFVIGYYTVMGLVYFLQKEWFLARLKKSSMHDKITKIII